MVLSFGYCHPVMIWNVLIVMKSLLLREETNIRLYINIKDKCGTIKKG